MTQASSSSSQLITEKSLIEEREAVVVSEKGDSLRKTHFLNPFVTSTDGTGVAELPRHRHRQRRLSVRSPELKGLFSRDSCSGFWFADRYFVSWLAKMEALHEPTWRKAGIFDAIKASTYNITRNTSLILSVADKWCPETKSFLFPWGEATITLEDVMVLLGFSVLGSPVSASLHTSEATRDAVEKLEKARRDIMSRDKSVSKNSWVSSFLGRDDDMEHEAFLVLWLSLYVFPVVSRLRISSRVFPIAVRLARGERIALAPAVLAAIYRDLGLISGLARGECDAKVKLRSLFKLVQVWTWERFKNTRPNAREIPKGEPRIAQWDSLQQVSANARLSSFDDFDWRPYTKPLKNWNPLRFYVDEAMWLTVSDSLDDEFVSFARCVKASQLGGDGFVEDYYPHRVAMQFGLAQDLPGLVTWRSNFTEKEAWDDYSKSLDGLKLYMPSRLSQGSVTARYRDWWLKSVSEEIQNESTETLAARNAFDNDDDDDDDLHASYKVLPLSQVVQKLEEGFPLKRKRSKKTCKLINKGRHYQMKRAHDDNDDDDDDDDSMTIAKYRKKFGDEKKDRGNTFGKRRRKFQVVDDSDDSGTCQNHASVKIEQRSEEEDETTSKTEETRQLCDDVNENAAAEEKFMVDEWTKKAEVWLREEGEKKRCNDKREEDVFERLKQRKMAVKEKGLKLDAGIMNVEKTLANIREWLTRRNH